MAGVNYEVNIQLNAKTLDKQLGDLEKRVNNLKKNLAAPLRGDESAARRAVATEQKRTRLAERRQATQIVTFNLGRKVNELEARGVDVSRIREKLNKAALENDKGRLTMARAQNSVARTLINQEQAKLRISTKAGRMQAENIDAAVSAREKRYSLDQKLRRLEEEGIKTDKLRSRFGDMTEAHRKHEFGLFKQIARELELSVRRERDKLALQKRQTRELQRQARMRGAVSPIGGAAFIAGSPAQIAASARAGGARSSIRGDINTPGSPAFIEAQQRKLSRLARQGGARSPIQGSADIPGSPAFITAQAQERDKALRRAAQLGGARSSITGDVNTPGSPAFVKAQQAELIRLGRIGGARSAVDGSVDIPGSPAFIRAQERERQKALREAAAMGGSRSPIMGGVDIPGSPLAIQAARRRRSERMQGVALGAGFPLLFGGGPGSILGGAAGGLVGGPAGFAAQIALSAIGQQFDKLGAAALDLGKALNPLTFDLKTVAGATGIAGTKTEEFLAKIEEFGGKAAAAAEASKLMAVRIGKDATDALTKFGKDAQTVGNQISIIFTKVLAAIAAAAGPLLASLGAGLTRINQLGGFKERTGLSGADLVAQQFLTRTGRLQPKQRQGYAVGLGLEATATAGQIRKAAEARAATSQQSFETQQATALEQKAVRLEAEAEAAKQPKKKGRRSRLPELQSEEKKLQDLLRLDREMFEFRRNDDALGVRRLEHQMRLVEFAEEKAKVQASDVPNAEKLQSIANIDLEIKREELQLAYDIDEINKKASQRAFEEMQNKIKQQNQLNKGLQQQLQLAEQVSNVLGQGMTQSFELLITGAENWGMALRDIAANVLRDIARQLIQIYVIEQAVSFMRTLFSGPSLTAPGGRYEGQAGALAAKPPPLPPLPGKALGGAVSSGKPYMVGERGPELFVPGAQGNIVPNSAMGGANITVNVDASGSNVQGNQPDAAQLGRAIGAAVQAELIKQKRPGGLLA